MVTKLLSRLVYNTRLGSGVDSLTKQQQQAAINKQASKEGVGKRGATVPKRSVGPPDPRGRPH